MAPERPDPSAYAELNADFYKATPWDYFERRLSHLMLVAADRDRYRAVFSEPIALGAIQIEIAAPATDAYPTPEQSFIAVESEVLLHHVAETLLRFVHAHADPDEPCPWLRMSALTSARRFKEWVEVTVVEAPRSHLAELCGRVFACHPDSAADLDAYIDYTRLLGDHFLDAAPYNAAKHGMGLTGGSERRQIELDGVEVFRRDGAVINWLAAWPQHDPDRPAGWTRASRLFSPEAAITVSFLSTNLMKSVWIRGRALHLDEPWDKTFSPPSPPELLDAFGVRHPVLADWYEPLQPNEHGRREITIKTRHIGSFEAGSPPVGERER